eukprot:2348349-Rhodomonas_salina.6
MAQAERALHEGGDVSSHLAKNGVSLLYRCTGTEQQGAGRSPDNSKRDQCQPSDNRKTRYHSSPQLCAGRPFDAPVGRNGHSPRAGRRVPSPAHAGSWLRQAGK